MLKPSMNELMARVNNRYLLVNLAAQRARDLSAESETSGEKLTDKAVKLALDEIADGSIVYCEGPRIEPEPVILPTVPEVLDLDSFEDGGDDSGEAAEDALFEDEELDDEDGEESGDGDGLGSAGEEWS